MVRRRAVHCCPRERVSRDDATGGSDTAAAVSRKIGGRGGVVEGEDEQCVNIK